MAGLRVLSSSSQELKHFHLHHLHLAVLLLYNHWLQAKHLLPDRPDVHCLQVTLQCQDRGKLMAELWQGLQCLVTALLANCETARLSLSSSAGSREGLQAAMPVLQHHHAE